MAYQLVYTSSPRGLKPGAFGFCVVACTRGMKEQTTSALEALSGYRRVYADPRDALRNPTSYSHVLFETATGRLRILARVADAGLDYSGRTNKIASFLDVATGELTPPGPAALFSQPGLFVTNWSSATPPQYYEAPISLPNYVSIPSGCDEWRNTTGDSAWAGVLASTVATRRPVALIVRPEQNVLRLFQESLALLPPGERWNATFSTYYMKTPPGVQCQWKAVMQGSPEELASRSTPGGLVLDLTAPNKLPSLASLATTPEAQTLVAAARGVNSSVAVPTQLPERAFQAVPNPATPPPAFDASPLPGAAPIGGTTPYDLASPVPSGAAPRRKTLNYGRDAILTVTPPPQRGNRETALLTKMLACVGAATILLGIVVAMLGSSGVFEKFGDAIEEREKAVAEANGLPATPSKSDDANNESTDVATSGTDESQEDSSKEDQNTKQDSDESSTPVESDVTDGKTSSAVISEKSQSQKATTTDVQKTEEKEDKIETGKSTTKSSENEDVETDDEEEDEASNVAAKKGKNGSKYDVKESGKNLDDVANEIEDNLELFEQGREGEIFLKTRDIVEQYRQIVKQSRQRKSSDELKAAIDHFDKIGDELKFDPLRSLSWDGKRAMNDLTSGNKIIFEEAAIYSDLDRFFDVFRDGAVSFVFRLYDDKGLTELPPYTITAKEFREERDKSNPSKIERNFDEETKDTLFVDLQNRLGGLHFQSEESARKWFLQGTFEFEAFADASSDESALVFSVPETPILNCSDLSPEKSEKRLDLSWLFEDKAPQFSISEPCANSLFVEQVRLEGSDLSPVTSQDEVKSISGKRNLDLKDSVVLRGSLSGLTGVTLVISFTSTATGRTTKGIKGDFKHYYRESDRPDGLPIETVPDSHELTFNVRYRASEHQKPEASPIVGVLKVPLKKH